MLPIRILLHIDRQLGPGQQILPVKGGRHLMREVDIESGPCSPQLNDEMVSRTSARQLVTRMGESVTGFSVFLLLGGILIKQPQCR